MTDRCTDRFNHLRMYDLMWNNRMKVKNVSTLVASNGIKLLTSVVLDLTTGTTVCSTMETLDCILVCLDLVFNWYTRLA